MSKNRFTIRIPDMGNDSCTEPDVKSAMAHLETLLAEGYPGEKFTVEIIEISDEDYAKLPEFMGW